MIYDCYHFSIFVYFYKKKKIAILTLPPLPLLALGLWRVLRRRIMKNPRQMSLFVLDQDAVAKNRS